MPQTWKGSKTLKKLLTRQARDDIINKLFRERQRTREVKKTSKKCWQGILDLLEYRSCLKRDKDLWELNKKPSAGLW